jgi:protein phosphatase
MGSTVSIAWVIGDRLYTAYVGDSRIYLLRKAEIHQISIDHTWLQGALDHHILTAEEAVGHPYGHVLQRAIGSPQPPEADFRLRLRADEPERQSIENQGYALQAGDQLLLCSDGLTDLVNDHEIREALIEQSPEQAAQSLLSLARARGGHDNITIVILAYAVALHPLQEPAPGKRRWLPVALVSALVLIAALFVALFLAWRFNLMNALGLAWPDAIPNPLNPILEEETAPLEDQEAADPTIATTPFASPSLSPAPTDTAVPLATVQIDQP